MMNYASKSCSLWMSTMLLQMRRHDEKGYTCSRRELGVPILMHKYLTGGFTANPRKKRATQREYVCFTEWKKVKERQREWILSWAFPEFKSYFIYLPDVWAKPPCLLSFKVIEPSCETDREGSSIQSHSSFIFPSLSQECSKGADQEAEPSLPPEIRENRLFYPQK